MERNSSSSTSPRNGEEEEKEGPFSCWGRLKLKLPWTKKRRIGSSSSSSSNSRANLTTQRRRSGWKIMRVFDTRKTRAGGGGGFRYDPLSYAQNFDEGLLDDDDEDALFRGFSSRFAPPSSRSLPPSSS
ncbi:hypothetical protein M5689_016904 [Euphorbia peplus]|nr:hypothetical protein M5689_016904 [Euphorbia peplus]